MKSCASFFQPLQVCLVLASAMSRGMSSQGSLQVHIFFFPPKSVLKIKHNKFIRSLSSVQSHQHLCCLCISSRAVTRMCLSPLPLDVPFLPSLPGGEWISASQFSHHFLTATAPSLRYAPNIPHKTSLEIIVHPDLTTSSLGKKLGWGSLSPSEPHTVTSIQPSCLCLL